MLCFKCCSANSFLKPPYIYILSFFFFDVSSYKIGIQINLIKANSHIKNVQDISLVTEISVVHAPSHNLIIHTLSEINNTCCEYMREGNDNIDLLRVIKFTFQQHFSISHNSAVNWCKKKQKKNNMSIVHFVIKAPIDRQHKQSTWLKSTHCQSQMAAINTRWPSRNSVF